MADFLHTIRNIMHKEQAATPSITQDNTCDRDTSTTLDVPETSSLPVLSSSSSYPVTVSAGFSLASTPVSTTPGYAVLPPTSLSGTLTYSPVALQSCLYV